MVRWRVSDSKLVHHVLLVLRHALLTQSLVVPHVKHIDGLVMFGANGILLVYMHRRSHLTLHELLAALPCQIWVHIYFVAV